MERKLDYEVDVSGGEPTEIEFVIPYFYRGLVRPKGWTDTIPKRDAESLIERGVAKLVKKTAPKPKKKDDD